MFLLHQGGRANRARRGLALSKRDQPDVAGSVAGHRYGYLRMEIISYGISREHSFRKAVEDHESPYWNTHCSIGLVFSEADQTPPNPSTNMRRLLLLIVGLVGIPRRC